MRAPPKRDLIFVGIQLLGLAAWMFDIDQIAAAVPAWLRIIGWMLCAGAVLFGILALVQLGGSFTPWPSPNESSKLVTSGTFAWARHPIYASLLVFGFGLAIATGSGWRLLVTLGLYLLFFRKAKYEEHLLRQRYPDYAVYEASVKRFGW